MSHAMTLVNGSTTITLGDTLTAYVPQAGNGVRPVTETVKYLLVGATKAALHTEIENLELAFERAREYQASRLGNQVYLNFTPDGYADIYRSEVLDGVVELDEDALDWEWVNQKIEISLVITRQPWWEGRETQLPLTNRYGAANITGLKMFNPAKRRFSTTIAFVAASHKITDSGNGLADFLTGDTIYVEGSASNDGTYTVTTGGVAGEIVVAQALVNEGAGPAVAVIGHKCNYVEIAGTDVDGSLPGPVKLELTQKTAGGVGYRNIYVGHSWKHNPASLNHILEGEDGTGGASAGSTVSSGGEHQVLTWATSAETKLVEWTIPASQLTKMKSDYFRALAIFSTEPDDDVWLRVKVLLSLTVVYEGPLIKCNNISHLIDLGAVQLPPAMEGVTDPCDLTLALYGKKTGGDTIYLDFFHLLPMDSYRLLQQIGYQIGADDTLVIDETVTPGGRVYGQDSSGLNRYAIWVRKGSPALMVQPGYTQRFYVLGDESLGQFTIGNEWSVKAYYRPRRQTL